MEPGQSVSEKNHNKSGLPSGDDAARDRRSDDLDQRLQNLNTKLGQHQAQETARVEAENKSDKNGLALAMRLSSEFVAGIVVGAAIGYAIDAFFGTSPWGMIIFFMLGFVAAILNVLRTSGMVAESQLHLHKVRELSDGQPPKDIESDKK